MENEGRIKQILEFLVQKWNIKKWRFENKLNGNDALNFIGKVVPVALINEENGSAIHAIIKSAPQGIPHFFESIIEEFFPREVFFYNKLLPIFKRYVEIGYENLIPECYFAEWNKVTKVVVLEDMTIQGFERHTDGLYLDQEHAMVTLHAIAKFHALSFIVEKKEKPLPGAQILKPFLDDYPDFFNRSQRFVARKFLFLFKGMQCENNVNKLCRYISNSKDLVQESIERSRKLVYAHGDMWKENILFKYSNSKPVEVCLVDFQMTRLMSPAAEVLFFIMGSIESSARRRYYKSFISTYHKTLQKTLKSNGLDPELYSEEDLKHDLKISFLTCFSLTFMAFLMWLQLESIENMNQERPSLPDLGSENVKVFKDIIENIILDFRALGFITDDMKL